MEPDAEGRYHRTARAFISPQSFKGLGREAKLAYLAGAFARFGDGKTFVLVNAGHKANLIAQSLRELGCSGVRLTSTEGLIPQTTTVFFEAGPRSEKLHRYGIKSTSKRRSHSRKEIGFEPPN